MVTGSLIMINGKWSISYGKDRMTKPFQSDEPGLAENQRVTLWIDEVNNTGSKEAPTGWNTSQILIGVGVAVLFFGGTAVALWALRKQEKETPNAPGSSGAFQIPHHYSQ
jgi:hypothetical protein